MVPTVSGVALQQRSLFLQWPQCPQYPILTPFFLNENGSRLRVRIHSSLPRIRGGNSGKKAKPLSELVEFGFRDAVAAQRHSEDLGGGRDAASRAIP